MLINQPEIPFSMNGILIRLSGESAFVLMSLLGANLAPHNLYLHSSIVQVLFPLIFNFPLCIYNEMSASVACFKNNIFNLLWILLLIIFCLFIKEKPASCKTVRGFRGLLPCFGTAEGLLSLINLMLKLTSTLRNTGLLLPLYSQSGIPSLMFIYTYRIYM